MNVYNDYTYKTERYIYTMIKKSRSDERIDKTTSGDEDGTGAGGLYNERVCTRLRGVLEKGRVGWTRGKSGWEEEHFNFNIYIQHPVGVFIFNKKREVVYCYCSRLYMFCIINVKIYKFNFFLFSSFINPI